VGLTDFRVNLANKGAEFRFLRFVNIYNLSNVTKLQKIFFYRIIVLTLTNLKSCVIINTKLKGESC
jgi:hypothetical protein